jgi:hypothetical protein
MSMLYIRQIRSAGAGFKAVPALVALLALAACGVTGSPETTALSSQEPIALTPAAKQDAAPGGSGALSGKVNEPELRKAVERYNLAKQRTPGPYEFAGVDLNGDGKSEAVVMFTGPDWCQKTGCSLVVFQEEQVGYRPVSHITSARPPVLIGPEASFGWRDLMANTGGGNAPVRTVRLGFSGKGYPANALLQPEPIAEMLGRSQQVMGETPSFAAALNQPPS